MIVVKPASRILTSYLYCRPQDTESFRAPIFKGEAKNWQEICRRRGNLYVPTTEEAKNPSERLVIKKEA